MGWLAEGERATGALGCCKPTDAGSVELRSSWAQGQQPQPVLLTTLYYPLPTCTQESLDAQLAAVFGTADLTSSKSLSLTEFLQCLHEYHLQRIRARPTLRSMKKGGSGGEPAAAAQGQAVAAK